MRCDAWCPGVDTCRQSKESIGPRFDGAHPDDVWLPFAYDEAPYINAVYSFAMVTPCDCH